MDRTTLAIMARKHWEQWLPEKVAELKAEEQLNAAIQVSARQAQEEIQVLMQQGYQEHEAMEVVLPQLIVLPPEPDESSEEARDAAEAERQYQEMMREPPERPDYWE